MPDLALPLSVSDAIRFHGYLTEKIARDRNKLDALTIIRGSITPEPDLSERWIEDNIKSDTEVLARLEKLLYG